MKKFGMRFLAVLMVFAFSVPAYARDSSCLPDIRGTSESYRISQGGREYNIERTLYNRDTAFFREMEKAVNRYYRETSEDRNWYTFSDDDVRIYTYTGSKSLPSTFLLYETFRNSRNPIRCFYIKESSLSLKNIIYGYAATTRSPYSFQGIGQSETAFCKAMTNVVAKGIAAEYGTSYSSSSSGYKIARELLNSNPEDLMIIFINPLNKSNFCKNSMGKDSRGRYYYDLLNKGIKKGDDYEDLVDLMSYSKLFPDL